MTPELKKACEVIFQEHKSSADPIAWNKDIFRGRLSMGLCEKAKQTLLSTNVICFPHRTKKTTTILHPSAIGASTYEEATALVQSEMPVPAPVLTPVMAEEPEPDYTDTEISLPPRYTHRVIHISHPQPQLALAKAKWYMKPVFFYLVWPICAIVVGVAISFLITEYVGELIRF